MLRGPASPWRDAGNFRKLLLLLGVFVVGVAGLDWALPPDLSRYRAASTEVLARDGVMLAAMPAAGGVWRLHTEAADVDPRYLALLMAAEDRAFWQHPGFNPVSLGRAAWQWVRTGHIVSGGSTLTMQTARLLEPHRRGVVGKLHDIVRALQLERRFSKAQILSMYLTLAPFGGNIESVRAASLIWFGHGPAQLSPQEAMLLVALPQSPSHRRPDRYPGRAAAAMVRLGARVTRLGVMPAWLEGAAALPQVHRHAMPRLAGLFAAGVARHAVPGARIRTTIDAGLQARLEALLARGMAGIAPQIGVAAMIVDARSREIRASVGGRGSLFSGGALDLTAARRSPGSALKPFIYGMAFDDLLLHPLSLIEDAPGLVPGYAPHNFDYEFHGAITAQTALRQSFNVPAVEVLSRVGAGGFVARLRQAGVRLALPGNRASLAVALGGVGISLQDMVMVYAALADDGQAAALVKLAGQAAVKRPFLGRLAVYYDRQILRGSPPPPGMAYAVLTGGPAIAFKTGTSYGFRDAWAVGYDSSTVIGVWTGRVDGTPRPGAFGRATAAPLMLNAFGLLPVEEAAEPVAPPGAILATRTEDLPLNLRRLGGVVAEHVVGPVLEFPPAGSTIDMLAGADGRALPVELRVSGGSAPYRWLINGAPVGGQGAVLAWQPDGPGTVRLRVIDSHDRAAGGVFQLVPGG